MMRKYLFGFTLYLLCLFIPFQKVTAQQNITGTVRDRSDNAPLPEVNILLLPSDQGTFSDSTGYFIIKNVFPGKYVLSVSMVGYRKEKYNIRVPDSKNVSFNIFLNRENKRIEEISIIGKGAEQRMLKNITIEPLSLKAAETVISHNDIEKEGAVTLMDALRYVPGGLTETRGRKVKQFFSVRGQTYPYPAYSVDGIMQKEFYETAPYLSAAGIERIKVDRSASALLKSLSPLSGVIDIVTRKYTRKETSLIAKYGSLNTFEAGVQHGNLTKKLEYGGGAYFFGTNGLAERNGRERIINVNSNMGWKINDNVKASVRLFYIGGYRQLVQPVEPAAKKFRNQKEKYDPLNTFMIVSKLDYKASKTLSGELQINYACRNPLYHIEFLNTGTDSSERYYDKDHELTLNHLNTWKISGNNMMRFGFLYNHWVAPNGKRYYYGNRADVHTWSSVVTDQQQAGKWLLDAGFRVSREYFKDWAAFAIEGSGKKFSKVQPITHEWQSPVWQASAGASWSANSLFSLHSNISTGIVTPRKGTLTADSIPPANEKRTNLDLGLQKKLARSGSLTITAFIVSRKEAIEYSGSTLALGNGDIMELYTNEDKRNYGIEATFHMQLAGDWLQGFANTAFMRGQIKKDKGWRADDEIPSFIGNLGCSFQKAGFDGNFFMNYTGPFKNDRFVSKTWLQENGKAPLGNFFNITLTAGYSLGKKRNTRAFLEVKNLLNTPFQTVPGYPDNGRIINLGIKINL